MRKALFAFAATATFAAASLISPPAKAVVLGSPLGLGAAAGALNPIESVRYCEYYDPAIDDYVVFWVPGPCLRVGAPGYDIWLGRYYRGHQHWRGRLSSRPWTHGGGSVRQGGGVRQGGTTYRSGGSVRQGGGGYRGGSAGGGQRVYRSGGGGGGSSGIQGGGGGGGMRGAVGRGGGAARGGGGMRGGGGGSARSGGSVHGGQGSAR